MKKVTNKLSLKGKLSLKRNKTDAETGGNSGVKCNEPTQQDIDNSKPSLLDSIEPPPPYAGLQNIGNTCFFNSVVQALRYTPGFRKGIKGLANMVKGLEREEEEKMDNGDYESLGVTSHMRFLGQLDRLFRSMQRAEDEYLDEFEIRAGLSVYPECLLNILKTIKPMFEGYLQHDAQELLCCFLSIIQDGCQELKSRLHDQPNAEHLPDNVAHGRREFGPEGKLLGGIKAEKNVSSTEFTEHFPRPSSSSVTRKTANAHCVSTEGHVKKKTLGIRRLKRPSNQTTISMFGVVQGNNVTESAVQSNEQCNAAKKIKVEFDNSKLNTNNSSLRTKRSRKSNAKVGRVLETKHELKVETEDLSEGMEEETRDPEASKKPDVQPEPVQMDVSCNSAATSGHLDLVERLFQGLVVLRTRCSECEQFNERTEDFQEVGLPVQKTSDAGTSSSNDCDLMPTNLSLSWALAEYTCTERLTDKNKYFCERCMQHNEAERSVLFHKLPAVLIFHLKRFSTVFSGFYPEGTVSKVNTHLATPLTLALTPWCSTKCDKRHQQYELYAIVMHSGTSSASGHYVCYARVPTYSVKPAGSEGTAPSSTPTDTSKWARFDDDMVEVLSEDDISSLLCPITNVPHSSTPYLLFYREVVAT